MLRELTSIAHDSTGYAVKAYAENGPVAMWLDSVRSALARAVWHAAKPLERLDEDDDTADDDAPAPARQKPGEPHQCPALPGQLHAVVTVGATVQDVHFAGLYEDPEAAADHVSGYAAHAKHLSDRHVKPAPGCPGEMLLELPEKRERHGVQLAVVVPCRCCPIRAARTRCRCSSPGTTRTTTTRPVTSERGPGPAQHAQGERAPTEAA